MFKPRAPDPRVRLVPASRVHVGPVGTRMRAADRTEVSAYGWSPKQALRRSLRHSTVSLTVLVDDRAEAMFGAVPFNIAEGVGRPWFLGTDVVSQFPREFLQRGLQLLPLLLDSFPRLENVVSADNAPALRLLRAWGFTIGDEVEHIGGVEFLPFWMERARV